MTERLKGFVVHLEEHIREDDAQPIIDAIRMIKYVLAVRPLVADYEHIMAVDEAKHDLKKKVYDVLK